jgi:hypothetical protein
MVDGKCTKEFPKDFCEVTTEDNNSYPVYRRRDNGRTFQQGQRPILDNRDVVPFNPYFSQKYDCHANLEICSSIQSVKYLYKYVYKGSDRAAFRLLHPEEDVNEIQDYVEGRYVSAPEAVWRLLKFKMGGMSHVVTALPVHLPGQHLVRFAENAPLEEVLRDQVDSKLTKFFSFCAANPDLCADITYPEIVSIATWVQKDWRERRRGETQSNIGRMYTVSIRDGERYFLRLLLLKKKCPKSFEDLRTIQDPQTNLPKICETFKKTCIELGFFLTDDEWKRVLEEGSLWQMPAQLRQCFCYILVFGNPANIQELFLEFVSQLSEDFIHQNPGLESERIQAMTLNAMNTLLAVHGKSIVDFPGLPALNLELMDQETPFERYIYI